MNILIVDDIQDNLDMLDLILKSKGHTVKQALNGKDALEMLYAGQYDLIISDILMPVMDGFQLCKTCKQDEKLQNIPFVFYTATYVDRKDEEFALSLGAHKFLVKPLDPETILAMVNDLDHEHVVHHDFSGDDEVREAEVYKLYSERLINKLEKKMQDLEKEVTRRKEAEVELIHAKERAEQSDRLKSAFLANISHEIRTPLNGIIGFASLLKELETDPVQQAKYVDIIVRSGHRLTSIIADIIEISKLESGQVSVDEDDINVAEWLTSIYDEMNFALPRDKHLILLKDDFDIPNHLVIRADRTKLSQIMTNLVSNAFKYTLEGSVAMGVRTEGQHMLRFYVKDTGIGIHPDYHGVIFERFRQVSKPSSVFQSGTGLGLAISKSYVELMGGRIWVNSKPGEGAAFYFTIPLLKSKAKNTATLPKTQLEGFDLTGKTVLVVEDDEDNYAFMEESLQNYHAQVVWAKNGEEAIRWVQKDENIDLVLMDIRMPVIDGYEATKKILMIRNDIKVIAQTAYAYADDKKKALESGCVDVITKPITVNEFLSVVDKHIR